MRSGDRATVGTPDEPDAYQAYLAKRRETVPSNVPDSRPQTRYGERVTEDRAPKPRVYRTPNGYRIVPHPGNTTVSDDDLSNLVVDSMPMALQILRLALLLIPPVGFVVWFWSERRYERRFWLENGFDPDSFARPT